MGEQGAVPTLPPGEAMSTAAGVDGLLRPCIVRQCHEPAEHIMCETHLNRPVTDNFIILDGCEVRQGSQFGIYVDN